MWRKELKALRGPDQTGDQTVTGAARLRAWSEPILRKHHPPAKRRAFLPVFARAGNSTKQVTNLTRLSECRNIARVGYNEPGPFPEVIWTKDHLIRS
jgi:hypothetical protein